MTSIQDEYYYSPKYEDDYFEYRHVHIPAEVAKRVPKSRLLSETEWRGLGIQQSLGWVHYMIHSPERHVLLFRRPKPGVDPEVAAAVAAQRDAGVSEAEAAPQTKSSSTEGANATTTGKSANFEAMRIH